MPTPDVITEDQAKMWCGVARLSVLVLAHTALPCPVLNLMRATPSLVPADLARTVEIEGTGLGAITSITLTTADGNVTSLAATVLSSAAASFAMPASAARSVLVQAHSSCTTSNLLVIQIFDCPVVNSFSPVITNIGGGARVTLIGTGFFASSSASVAITVDSITLSAEAQYASDALTFVMPQFPIPSGIDRQALAPGQTVGVAANVSLALNGIDFYPMGSMQLQVNRKFRIGYA